MKVHEIKFKTDLMNEKKTNSIKKNYLKNLAVLLRNFISFKSQIR